MFQYVGVWYYLEFLFFPLDIILQSALIAYRRTTVLRSVPWFVLYFLAPIVGFGAYIMVGRAVFPKRIPVKRSEKPKQCALDDHEKNIVLALGNSGAGRYSADSDVSYFNDGKSYFESLLADLASARTSICIECYLIRSDEFSKEFIRLLAKKAENGIRVRIIFDDFGYDGKDFTYVRKLRAAGAECGIFHNMTRTLFSPLKNYRNHRKLTIIDGEISFLGGYNIGEEYITGGRFGSWNDSAVRIVGPQSQELLDSFAEVWKYVVHEDISKDGLIFRRVPPAGNIPMMTVSGNPTISEENPFLAQMIQMFKNAKHRIVIETPYLNFPKEVLSILKEKCEKGLKLYVLIPALEDHPAVYWCNRWVAYHLIGAGARVFEYTGGFLHGKVSICDGSYCSVGSANYDMRSVTLNFECNALVFSKNIAEKVEAAADKALRHSTEYTAETYESRTPWQRFRTGISLLFRSQI